MTVAISSALLAAIRAEATSSPDLEMCGLLFGQSGRIDAATPCRNVAADPARRFEIDPAPLLAAYRAMRGGGDRLVGWYHSHPHGDPMPSPRDAADAAPDGMLWLIVGGADARLWRAVASGRVEGRFDPVALVVAPACAADSAGPQTNEARFSESA